MRYEKLVSTLEEFKKDYGNSFELNNNFKKIENEMKQLKDIKEGFNKLKLNET